MLPILPIIMAVAGLGSGIASGISAVNSAKSQAKAIQQSPQEPRDERARQARKLMSQQKTSFLKSGVYFSGSPTDVINETYNTSITDIDTLKRNANNQIKSLQNQANLGFISGVGKGIASAALGYVGAGGGGLLASAKGGFLQARNSILGGIKGFGNVGDFTTQAGNIIKPASGIIA